MAKFNFTKANIEALSLPSAGKRAYHYDTKQRGLGVSVTSQGTKTFIVYRKINGMPERIFLGHYPDLTIEQARGKAAEAMAAIARGESPADRRRAARAEMTLGELFTEYMERHAKLHKKSWEKDQSMFRLYLSHWTNRKLSAIHKSDIQALHAKVG